VIHSFKAGLIPEYITVLQSSAPTPTKPIWTS